MISLFIFLLLVVAFVAIAIWLIRMLPMDANIQQILIVVVVLIALLVVLSRFLPLMGVSYAAEPHMHGMKQADADWYGSRPDGCCNAQDCRMAAFREVQIGEMGWLVATTDEMIPFGDARIKKSLDLLIHVCLKSLPRISIRCIYIPDPGI